MWQRLDVTAHSEGAVEIVNCFRSIPYRTQDSSYGGTECYCTHRLNLTQATASHSLSDPYSAADGSNNRASRPCWILEQSVTVCFLVWSFLVGKIGSFSCLIKHLLRWNNRQPCIKWPDNSHLGAYTGISAHRPCSQTFCEHDLPLVYWEEMRLWDKIQQSLVLMFEFRVCWGGQHRLWMRCFPQWKSKRHIMYWVVNNFNDLNLFKTKWNLRDI